MLNFQHKITLKHIGLSLGCCSYFTQGLHHTWSSCTPGQIPSAELLFYILLLLIYMQSPFRPGQALFSQPPPVPVSWGICLWAGLMEQWGESWWGTSMEIPKAQWMLKRGLYAQVYSQTTAREQDLLVPATKPWVMMRTVSVELFSMFFCLGLIRSAVWAVQLPLAAW